MAEYDEYAQAHLPEKVPDRRGGDSRRFVGDAMYDFSVLPPAVRPAVHDESHRIRDLGGENALLSDHFFYFGRDPLAIPKELQPIVASTQGHRSTMNQPYVDQFIAWIEGAGHEPNVVHAPPDADIHDRLLDLDEDQATLRCSRPQKARGCDG